MRNDFSLRSQISLFALKSDADQSKNLLRERLKSRENTSHGRQRNRREEVVNEALLAVDGL
jgi:hypothetical protein